MPTDTVCPKCGGTGFIVVESAHVSSAKRCDCGAKGRAETLELMRNYLCSGFPWANLGYTQARNLYLSQLASKWFETCMTSAANIRSSR